MPPQFIRNTKLVVRTAFIEYDVSELEFQFDVMLRRDSKPNTARIDIYNLSRDRQNAFKDEQQYTSVELYAGYGKDIEPPLIFSGTAANISTIKPDKVNFQTTIFAGDGQAEFEKSYFSKTYDEGVVLDTIFTEIAKALGMDIGANVLEMKLTKSKRPIVLDGKAKDVLDILTKDFDLSWTVQFGVLEITKNGEAPPKEQTAVVLGPNSGILGSPTLSWSKKKKNKKSKPTFVSSLRVRANMNGDLRPNRFVELRAENTVVNYGSISVETIPNTDANGTYLIDRVRYRGDNRKGPYEVEVTADGR